MIEKINTQRGFTIVELLIVIVVIGVLAAITTVAFNGVQDKARTAAVSSSLASASRQLENANTDNGSYPADTTAIKKADDVAYQYSYTTSTNSYCLTATKSTTSYKITNTATTPVKGGCPGHDVGGVAALTNFVSNPSFESGASGWTFSSAAGYTGAVSSAQAYSGNSSYSMTVADVVADRYLESYTTVSTGTYTVSAYVYLTSSGATAYNRDTMLNCGTGTCTAGTSSLYDRTKLNQWQRVQNTLTVSSASATIRARFHGPTNGVTYVDGVMITTGASAAAYADGNSPNWVWNGTVNNSTSKGMAL